MSTTVPGKSPIRPLVNSAPAGSPREPWPPLDDVTDILFLSSKGGGDNPGDNNSGADSSGGDNSDSGDTSGDEAEGGDRNTSNESGN